MVGVVQNICCAPTPSGLDMAIVVAVNSPQPKAHTKQRNHVEVTSRFI